MARTYYHDFIDEAREQFDLSYDEAVDYYHDLKGQGFQRDDFIDFAEEVFEEEPEEREPFEEVDERDWFDDLEYVEWDYDDVEDYWLDEGEEIELTADLAYEEGK